MQIEPRKMFWLDGLGALVSATSIGLIIANQEEIFGLPKEAAYFLAFIPCLFLLFSWFHYYNFPKVWRPALKMIAVANLCYCILSIGVVFYHFQVLTNLGLAYFILEFIVVLFVVVLELRIVKNGSMAR